MNVVYLGGRLDKEPYVGTTKKGKAFAFGRIRAETMGRTDKIDFTAWGELADQLSELEPGTAISIVGRLQNNKREDKDTWELRVEATDLKWGEDAAL